MMISSHRCQWSPEGRLGPWRGQRAPGPCRKPPIDLPQLQKTTVKRRRLFGGTADAGRVELCGGIRARVRGFLIATMVCLCCIQRLFSASPLTSKLNSSPCLEQYNGHFCYYFKGIVQHLFRVTF
uniref:Uncharacterized protein n=1 Tax=Micrurus lemniscatus lemniscatus TaxID=129467 RepID=A0A2D4JRH6_MICLE